MQAAYDMNGIAVSPNKIMVFSHRHFTVYDYGRGHLDTIEFHEPLISALFNIICTTYWPTSSMMRRWHRHADRAPTLCSRRVSLLTSSPWIFLLSIIAMKAYDAVKQIISPHSSLVHCRRWYWYIEHACLRGQYFNITWIVECRKLAILNGKNAHSSGHHSRREPGVLHDAILTSLWCDAKNIRAHLSYPWLRHINTLMMNRINSKSSQYSCSQAYYRVAACS